jgi:hypothetical protein
MAWPVAERLPRFSCFAGFTAETHGPQSAIQLAPETTFASVLIVEGL